MASGVGSRDSTLISPTMHEDGETVPENHSEHACSVPLPDEKARSESVACDEPPRKKSRWEKPAPPTNAALRSRTMFVPARQQTLLRLPSGIMKQVTLEPGKMISLGKFGTFQADEIIGRPFGLTYEIQADGSLQIMQQAVAEALGTQMSSSLQLRVRPRMKTSLMMVSRRRCPMRTFKR